MTTAPDTQIVNYGDKATKPKKDPTVFGYSFGGWYKDYYCTKPFDFNNTVITEDITLYAKFIDGQFYTVTFDANGHGTAPEPQLVEIGQLAARPDPDPTAEGYVFNGWGKSQSGWDGFFDFDTETIKGDITLYASWSDAVYVTFDANGGTGTMDPVAVAYGDWCTLPECGFTAPEGKQFKGWAFSPDSTEVVGFTSFEVYGDRTLYAIWEDKPVTGYTVSGTATSFGSSTDDVMIQLTESGASEPSYEAVVKGNTASYSIEGVAPGTYTMRVMKKNHVMREYTVTVSAENVTQDVKICLLGDVNSDGKINVLDAIFVQKNGVGLITLSDAQLQSADVNGDGKVNIRDAIIIQKLCVEYD